MSEIEIITDGVRRRRWSSAEKLRIVEETLDGRESISVVAHRNGVAPNLLYRWRRLMLEGGSVAVAGDDDVTSNRTVLQLEDRVRELERQLGRKTLEVEILKEALDKARAKNRPCLRSRRFGTVPDERVAETLGVSRSNLHDRANGKTKPRRRYHKVQDGERRTPCVRESRERAAIDRTAGRGAPDLRLPAHHGGSQPPAAQSGPRRSQSQEGLPHHEGQLDLPDFCGERLARIIHEKAAEVA